METALIDSILYFMAFIPLVMVPIVVIQIGPYVVVKGINTLMRADAEEGSAERYFGIAPEEDLMAPETYKVDKEKMTDQLHTKKYIGMKILSVITVAIILGLQYSSGAFDAHLMLHWLVTKMTWAFLVAVLFYGASMLALFDHFKDYVKGRIIEGVIFYLDGLVIASIAGIIVANFRF